MELKMENFFGEILATFFLVFLTSVSVAGFNESFLIPSIFAGLSVYLVVNFFGITHIGHCNPCISAVSLMHGTMTFCAFLAAVLAQLIGAVAGYCAAATIFPSNIDHLYEVMNSAPRGISMQKALVVEVGCTAFYVFAWIVAREFRFEYGICLTSWLLEFVMIVCSLVAVRYTGASFNPVRTYAVCYRHKEFENFWYFVAAQVIGAQVAFNAWHFRCLETDWVEMMREAREMESY